jgi:gamma-glutamyl phosphate reductase
MMCTDDATALRATADALAKAALSTAQRAFFTAQLARDALLRAGRADGAAVMEALRDGLLDAAARVPEAERQRISASKAALTSDELIDLLALSVRG